MRVSRCINAPLEDELCLKHPQNKWAQTRSTNSILQQPRITKLMLLRTVLSFHVATLQNLAVTRLKSHLPIHTPPTYSDRGRAVFIMENQRSSKIRLKI